MCRCLRMLAVFLLILVTCTIRTVDAEEPNALPPAALRQEGIPAPQPAPVGTVLLPSGHEAARGRLLIKLAPESGAQQVGLKGAWTTQAGLNDVLLAQNVERLEALFKPAAGSESLQKAIPSDLGRWYRAELNDSKADIAVVVRALRDAPGVEWAEPDYVARAAAPARAVLQATANDPRYGEQWGLTKIEIEDAWDETYGDPGIVIAVIDSGIDLSHADLTPNLWSNPGEVPANGLDDDNNGFIDDVHGWNFVSDSNNVADDSGHGTLVSGIAAARTNNGTGVAGVCGHCRLMPVKVMQPSGAANYSDIAQGIVYATDKGARVINLSLGGYADSQAVHDAVAYARSHDAVLVGGAGNDNTSTAFYPAAYDDVIAVAGTTISDTRTTSSNTGDWVDVCAPGEDILTTALGGDYLQNSGTSMAAPFASGLAGLLLSLHPGWTPAMVCTQLRHTADDIDSLNPGCEGQLGAGRINASQAMAPPEPLLTGMGYSVDDTPNGRPDHGASATVDVPVNNDWADATAVSGLLSTNDAHVTVDTATASYGDIASGETVLNATSYEITIAGTAGYNHAIPFALELTANGGSYVTTVVFTVTTRSNVQNVAGTIATNTVWTGDKIYCVTDDVGVAPGVTLTIQAGTVVKFKSGKKLDVGGTLIAEGTAEQPITFMPNSTGTWERIFFDDSSVDAIADAAGAYQSGCILRHVQVQGATNGIVSSNATPYLAHLSVDGAGIDCDLGATPLWLLDSDMTAGATIDATAHVRRSDISGALNAGAVSDVLTSTVVGDVNLGAGSLVQATDAGGGIAIGGNGAIADCSAVGNVSLTQGTVSGNEIAGGNVNVTTGLVCSNTLTAGGITVGGSSTVQGNDIEDAPGTAIQTSGTVTVTRNRVVGPEGKGIVVSTGLVQGNLIAYCKGRGLQVGAATVVSNTLIGIEGHALYTTGGVPVKVEGNNLDQNTGDYDLYNDNPSGQILIAQHNWWGTTDTIAVASRIHDHNDDYTKGLVSYTPVLTTSCASAPAYMRSVIMDPGSPVGIETADFEIEFSRKMAQDTSATVSFHSTRRGSWTVYNKGNSSLPRNIVLATAIDADGSKWFGTEGGGVARFDGSDWTIYNTSNSGLQGNDVRVIAIDTDGSKWFHVYNSGMARFDGSTWTVYNTTNSGLPHNYIMAMAIDANGVKWFGTDGGVARFDDSTWTVYNKGNSDLPHNRVCAVAIDADGSKWFGTYGGGAAHFDGATWTVYNTGNSGLPHNVVNEIAIDANHSRWLCTHGGGVARFDGMTWTVYNTFNSGVPDNRINTIAIESDGSKWFGTAGGGVARFDGTTWTVHNTTNSGLPNNGICGIAIDAGGSKWFGTYGGGVGLLHHGKDYSVSDDTQWLSPTQHHATYDFTTLVPRDSYALTVSGARGTDGIEIAPYSGFTFTVDYAGYISDQTPPDPPSVKAYGQGNTTSLKGTWSASDPDSAITLYRYAIGSSPGGSDVVDWTNIDATQVTRTGLDLPSGQTYHVSVQARNEGGLWSEAGVSNGVVLGTYEWEGRWGARFLGYDTQERYPRMLGDVDGDRQADVVGFDPDNGVYVALSQGTTYGPEARWSTQYRAYKSQHWRPRVLGDVNGDGRQDIVAFNPQKGVFVSLSKGNWFRKQRGWNWRFKAFTNQEQYPRMLGDVNGDGRHDIVAFDPAKGVYVGLSSGTKFANPVRWSTGFENYTSQNQHPRIMGDVNGDGMDDIVAFMPGKGVYVALSTGSGFGDATRWSRQFRWDDTMEERPRMIADVNNDGLMDIVLFRPKKGVYIALSTGNGFDNMSFWGKHYKAYGSQDALPRLVDDINKDGKADLVGLNPDRGPMVSLFEEL